VFAFQDKRGSVEVAFTDRFGGVSTGPYAELSLLAQEGDDPGAVSENLDIVGYAMMRGAPPESSADPFDLSGSVTARGIVTMRQVHGAEVAVVSEEPLQDEPVADALVTADPGWILAARAADCVPVLLADPERGLVAAAHAGRAGVVAGVVPNAVAVLRRLGAGRLVAWVGPHACGRCYEVPGAMRDEVAALLPQTWAETSWGTPALDLGAGVRAQLLAADAEVVEVGRCTIEDDAFYSYRRQARSAGRHAGLIWARP
jgi:YfiH family protein